MLDIAVGYAADSTNAVMITGTAFTKSTAGSWAAGSGGNGMGTGLTIAASTWYHVFAIINAAAFDVYFDTSVTAANKPASTTAFRYIGSFRTDGSSHILAFTQYGQKFTWTSQILSLNTGTAASATLFTVSTPLGFVTFPYLIMHDTTGGLAGDTLTVYPGNNSTQEDIHYTLPVPVATAFGYFYGSTTTNTSSQVYYSANGGGGGLTVFTVGYVNPHLAAWF